MKILSINSTGSVRIAAFIDDAGQAQIRRFPADTADDRIREELGRMSGNPKGRSRKK